MTVHLPPSASRLARRIRRKINDLAAGRIDVLDFLIWYTLCASWDTLYDDAFTAILRVLDAINADYHTSQATEDGIRARILAARSLLVAFERSKL